MSVETSTLISTTIMENILWNVLVLFEGKNTVIMKLLLLL